MTHKKIAFTLCSNNYLAHAKILADSLLEHNPDYKFYIGLVDKKSDLIDYSPFHNVQIVTIEELNISNFDNLWKQYDIVELNTCVKASFFKYLILNNQEVECLFYFDPDIMIFNKLENLEVELRNNDILLTPHILSPITLDNLLPFENSFLNYGIYNLGFLALRNTNGVKNFLNWWEERILQYGYNKPSIGLFVDQLWINLVPIFFKKTKILYSLGYNVGPWNLHERRKLNYTGNSYLMTDGSILAFYHFSSFDYKTPAQLSKYYNRYNFDNCPDIKPLYDVYYKLLIDNNVENLSKQICYYVAKRKELLSESCTKNETYLKKKIKAIIRSITPPILLKVKNLIYQ